MSEPKTLIAIAIKTTIFEYMNLHSLQMLDSGYLVKLLDHAVMYVLIIHTPGLTSLRRRGFSPNNPLV